MNVHLEKDGTGNPVRIYATGEGRISCELIRTNIKIEDVPVYQKGLRDNLLDSCKLAVEAFSKLGVEFYMVHNDRRKPCLVDGSMNPFEIEQFLLKQ